MLSPLRYPGSKSDFAALAFSILQSTGNAGGTLIEPFAGSGIVSLSLLDAGLISNAVLIEKDVLVYSFWQALFNHTDELIAKFQELPITLETWHSLRPLMETRTASASDVVQLGLACLFFNRANFSGILKAGPIGGMKQASKYTIDCRTNKDEIIVRLLAAATLAERVTVHHADAVEFLSRKLPKNCVLYVDPPYFVKGELLYRHHYKMADHRNLAAVLEKVRAPWLLSYDVHHIIEHLYAHFEVTKLRFSYSAHSPKNHDELLISNFVIDPLLFEGSLVRKGRQAHSRRGELTNELQFQMQFD